MKPMDKQQGSNQQMNKPAYVVGLESAYGAPSQNGFGSSVFFEKLEKDAALEEAALGKYKYFVGDIWDRFGEEAWMSAWKQVYARQKGATPDIVSELRGITDLDTALSVPMVLDVVQNADAARQALTAAYDDKAVLELKVFNLGDSGAMSGLCIAGRRANDETTFLLFLYD